jgi:hypothetical protein
MSIIPLHLLGSTRNGNYHNRIQANVYSHHLPYHEALILVARGYDPIRITRITAIRKMISKNHRPRRPSFRWDPVRMIWHGRGASMGMEYFFKMIYMCYRNTKWIVEPFTPVFWVPPLIRARSVVVVVVLVQMSSHHPRRVVTGRHRL